MERVALKEHENSIRQAAGLYVTVQTTSFSGATLLGSLLGAHPQIATVAEMDGPLKGVDINNYLCSCGQKITGCEFWGAVQSLMHNQGYKFTLANFGTRFELKGSRLVQYLRKGSTRNNTLDAVRDAVFQVLPGEKRQLELLVAQNDALIEAILTITGKDVFVDTSKGRLRLRAMRQFSRFGLRVIHLVRDVRGVVASNLRRDRTITLAEAAQKWVKLHERHERALAALPQELFIRIRYEDLCQDVPGALRRLYEFCGVNPEVDLNDFQDIPQHLIGNKMRLKVQSAITLDERWRDELTASQLQEIERIAGKLSRQYGYS